MEMYKNLLSDLSMFVKRNYLDKLLNLGSGEERFQMNKVWIGNWGWSCWSNPECYWYPLVKRLIV